MKIFTKILFFAVILCSCAAGNPRVGKTGDEIRRINARGSLRKEQDARQKRAEEARKVQADVEEESLYAKQKKKEEKLLKKALKKGKKRHSKWQSAETRKRMKQNKKASEKNFTNN